MLTYSQMWLAGLAPDPRHTILLVSDSFVQLLLYTIYVYDREYYFHEYTYDKTTLPVPVIKYNCKDLCSCEYQVCFHIFFKGFIILYFSDGYIFL